MTFNDARRARMDRLYAGLQNDDRRDWDKAIAACGAEPKHGDFIAVPARLLKRIEELAQPLDEREALANELDGYAERLETHYSTFPWWAVRRAAELLRIDSRAKQTTTEGQP